MQFIEFTTISGAKVIVNPFYISNVFHHSNNSCQIVMANHDRFTINISVEDLMDVLTSEDVDDPS